LNQSFVGNVSSAQVSVDISMQAALNIVVYMVWFIHAFLWLGWRKATWVKLSGSRVASTNQILLKMFYMWQ